VARCAEGFPLAIAVAPLLDDGSPFPTTFWLMCPRLVEAVHDLESAGQGARFAKRVAQDPGLAAALVEADTRYREARRLEGGGTDPCESVGTAGQSDALAVKCLHARLAARLAGVSDPIGEEIVSLLGDVYIGTCDDERCRPRAVTG
jgi:hypothetical protein